MRLLVRCGPAAMAPRKVAAPRVRHDGSHVAIALIAALVAGDDHAGQRHSDVLQIVWGTTVGLELAHLFAIVLSARLVEDPDLHHTATELFSSQMLLALAVCLAATVVVLVLRVDVERFGARITAAAFLAALHFFMPPTLTQPACRGR